MNRLSLLVALAAAAAAGCAEDELDRAPRPAADAVQLANREPGAGCCGLGAVEVRSGRDDEPSSEALREYAAARGANYVVVDTFTVYDDSEDTPVLTRARLFRCARVTLAVE